MVGRMRLALDTNILLDYLLSRDPYVAKAIKLFTLGHLGELELWFGTSQVTDMLYFVTEGGRSTLAGVARSQMAQLREITHIYATNEADYDAVSNSTWDDLEDAFVYQTALAVKADAIITRDKTGFGKSFLRVFDYDAFFRYLEEEKGLVYEIVDF